MDSIGLIGERTTERWWPRQNSGDAECADSTHFKDRDEIVIVSDFASNKCSSSNSIMNTLDVAEAAARAGGDVLLGYFKEGISFRAKADCDLVSDADIESENTIRDVIRSSFPDHAIWGEESEAADPNAEHLWIVDPLDGTTNFAHDIPHFAVSVAYYSRGEPKCGVVWNPARSDLYTTSTGGGAFHNEERVNVSPCTRLDEVLIGVGFYYDRGAMMEATLRAISELFGNHIHGIRRFGTAALDLCQVGIGQFGGFFEYELSPWDFAAGRLFVEEAGGSVTTCAGANLPIAKSTVLASNGRLHQMLLDIVSRHMP